MVARILPAAEWHRVQHRAVGRLCRAGDESSVQILVVEDEGQIVCSWAYVLVMHLEGLEIDEPYRKSGAAGRALLGLMRKAGRLLGLGTVETGAESDEVEQLLLKAGATRRKYVPYVLPVESMRPYRVAGRAFHEALERLPGHAAHPEDVGHDIAVGRLLLDRVDAVDAVFKYNDWATDSGYQLIKAFGREPDGGWSVTFETERIRVNAAMEPVEVTPCQ